MKRIRLPPERLHRRRGQIAARVHAPFRLVHQRYARILPKRRNALIRHALHNLLRKRCVAKILPFSTVEQIAAPVAGYAQLFKHPAVALHHRYAVAPSGRRNGRRPDAAGPLDPVFQDRVQHERSPPLYISGEGGKGVS